MKYAAIHAALLVDRLRDDFSPAWRKEFAPALDDFLLTLKGADKVADTDPKYRYWSQYGSWTRASSDRGYTICRRHSFYVSEMLARMPTVVPKDEKRAFSADQRELIYLSQRKTCAVCERGVNWSDAEIHHVQEHHKGGKTALANAALVHKLCHPKSEADVRELAEKWSLRN